jgi:predicted Zn-dependent peptidase
MKKRTSFIQILASSGIVTGLLVLAAPAARAASAPIPESATLPNGIRTVSVYFPGSTNVSIFTFLPLGLAKDGPAQAQWSHLVEHLVIRSTIQGELSMANAETLPDCMHLDFYGNLNNWREGLSHHRRWLEGVPFTQTSLETEKPRVKEECGFTVQNLYTHKFALAAWAQGLRHGQTNAALLGDIDRVSLQEIQAYRDEHFAVLSNVVVCIVSGIEPASALPVMADQLGRIESHAKPMAPMSPHPHSKALTWDLKARHLVITWPAPGVEEEDFAALLVAGQWLNMRFFSDPEIKTLAGLTLAGSDLAIPEGNFFYVSASLRPGASFEELQQKLERQVALLSSSGEWSMLPMLRQQLADSLTAVPDLASLKNQLPPNVSQAVVEGNIGLQWGLNEYRYGARRAGLAQKLLKLKAQDIQRAAKKYLREERSSVTCIHG